jgi:hypothetical protein
MEHDIMELKSYIHITSPIRRLVDLLNQTIFLKEFGLIKERSDKSSLFLEKWLRDIDYINNSMRSIRKIQTECSLLNLCLKDSNILSSIHTGIVFDKIKKSDGTYNYMVYLQSIRMLCRYICPINMENYSKGKFMLFVFHNEDKFKKKIKLQLI